VIDFSIIIITRNRKWDLVRAIKSILRQSYNENNLEIIIIDNASEDGTVEYVNEYLRDNFSGDYVVLPQKANLGVSGGRNLGIKVAKGQYLFFLDDDAYIVEDDFFERASHYFKENPKVGALACNIYDRKYLITRNPPLSRLNGHILSLAFRGGAHFIRRELFDKGLKYYPPDLFFGAEELYLAYQIYDMGYQIHFVPELFVVHAPSNVAFFSSTVRLYRNIINRYVITHLLFQNPKYRYLSTLLFLGRIIKNFGIKITLVKEAFAEANDLLKKCKTYEKKLKNETIKFLMSKWGIREVF